MTNWLENFNFSTKIKITQGPTHQREIVDHMKKVVVACCEEFTEDNKPTMDSYMDECFALAKEEVFREFYKVTESR